MNKPKIVFRADGSSEIGLGHIYRTLCLANYLKNYFQIRFVSYKPDDFVIELLGKQNFPIHSLQKPDYKEVSSFLEILNHDEIIVLDGYQFKTSYQAQLKNLNFKFVCIDDLNQWENVGDVVINHAYSGNKSDYKLSSQTQLYCGLEYAIIREEFLNTTISLKKSIQNILICIGGTDLNNLSLEIASIVLKNSKKKISILTSPLNPNYDVLLELEKEHVDKVKLFHSLNSFQLKNLIQSCEIGILQPSNIALEAAALGIGIKLIQTADNQKHILDTLVQANCADKLENISEIEKIDDFNVNEINKHISNQHKLIDNKSPQRLLAIFSELALTSHKVKLEHAQLIFDWNNDEGTRKNSFNQEKINYEDHLSWFKNKLNDKSCFFYIFKFADVYAGCVRIENKNNEVIIGITIAPNMRGKRLATPILNKSARIYFKEYNSNNIVAYIKETNEASLKSFVAAGFTIINKGIYFNETSFKLIKENYEF